MSYFNDVQAAGLMSGIYICYKCLGEMEFEDESHQTLICPECGFEVDIDDYGHEEEDESERFPTREQVLGSDGDEDDPDNEYGEYYDPEIDE